MPHKKKIQHTQQTRTSSQAPQQATRASQTPTNERTQDNPSHPLGLSNPCHVTYYNHLSGKDVMATHYYDEDLLKQVGLLNDIMWLFTSGGGG